MAPLNPKVINTNPTYDNIAEQQYDRFSTTFKF